MKKPEKEGKDLANFRLRMREEHRAGIEAAAAESGRSMNAEIIHRLEDYDRAMRAADVLSSDPIVQRLVIEIARQRGQVRDEAETEAAKGRAWPRANEEYHFLTDAALIARRLTDAHVAQGDVTNPIAIRQPMNSWANLQRTPREALREFKEQVYATPEHYYRAAESYLRQLGGTAERLTEMGMPAEQAIEEMEKLQFHIWQWFAVGDTPEGHEGTAEEKMVEARKADRAAALAARRDGRTQPT